MTKKITKVTSTLEGEETKSNKSLHTQQSKTQTDVQAILTEQEKREVQYFLSKMEGVKQGCSRTGEKNEAEEIIKEFAKSAPHIRGSKDIIRKLWSMQYKSYDSRSNYLGVATYNYDHKVINSATPEILNDKEFILELIQSNPKIINGLDKNAGVVKDKDFILQAVKSIKGKKDRNDGIGAKDLRNNIDDTFKADEDIIKEILELGEYRTACEVKEYLLQHDTLIWENREVMKKLVLGTGGYNRHLYTESISDDEEYILMVYEKSGLGGFYTFDDNKRGWYETFHQKIKEMLVRAGGIKEDEVFLKNIYKKRPQLTTHQIHLDAQLLQQFSSAERYKNNSDISNIKTLEDITTLMDKYIKRSDVQEMAKLIHYLKSYKDCGVESFAENYIKKFIEENNIHTIDEAFLALPENTRLLITQYWHDNKTEENYQDFNFGCGGHGSFKNPTSHEGCIIGERNLKRAKLNQLAKYTGERCYSIPSKTYSDAKNEIVQQNNPDFSENTKALDGLIKEYESIQKECSERNKKKASLEKIIKNNDKVTSDDILNHMPAFVDHIKDTEGAHQIRIDIANKVAAYIQGTSRDSKSAGMEYGNYVAVRYNGKRKDVHVVYRDAYDPKKDDRSLNFSALDIKNIETKADKIVVTIQASSNKNSRTYTFDFPLAKEEKPGLSKEEQEKFTETFESTKQKILLEQLKKYDGRQMPVYCLPPEMTYDNMPGGDVPYLRPTIASECIDKTNGIGVIVIYKQIDHAADRKRQLAREGRLINADGSYDRVEYENMRDAERLHGKQVKMVAQEIVGKYDVPKTK